MAIREQTTCIHLTFNRIIWSLFSIHVARLMLRQGFVFIILLMFISIAHADRWQQGLTAYQNKNYQLAINAWEQLQPFEQLEADKKILTYSMLGDAYLAMTEISQAHRYLTNDNITQLAQQTSNNAIKAHYFNNRGNMWMLFLAEERDHRTVEKYYKRAIQDYDTAFYATLASESQTAMLVNVLSNEIQAHLKTKEKLITLETILDKRYQPFLKPLKESVELHIQNALPLLLVAQDHVLFDLPDENKDKPFLMLSLGQLAVRYYDMQQAHTLEATNFPKVIKPIEILEIAELLFRYTVQLGQGNSSDATYIQSYANGLLAKICEYYTLNPEFYESADKNAYHACANHLIVGQAEAETIACHYCPEHRQACRQDNQRILFCKQNKQQNKLAAYEIGLLQTRTAISYASQNINTYTPSLLYLWYWQAGRILQHRAKMFCAQPQSETQCNKNLYDALLAYQNAVQVLQPIQSELVTGQRNSQETLNERIKPVYFGLAELLLQHADHSTGQQKQDLLESAIQSIESIKKTELQEYFQSNCLLDDNKDALYNLLEHLIKYEPSAKLLPKPLRNKIRPTSAVIPDDKAALLYPIIFHDQIALLLRLANGEIHYIKQEIPHIVEQVKKQVYSLRLKLENARERRYKREAKKLYRWFISPINALLQQNDVETLIVIPDELLRMIPFSALYNPEQKRFLAEERALVTVPSYDSVTNNKTPIRQFSVLLNGLSEKSKVAPEFPPLVNVKSEIKHIQSLFNKPKVLINKGFTSESFEYSMKLRPYSIVHIASHGQFKSDPTETFLLTFDKRLGINELEKALSFSQKQGYPVELLTLSACQTAAGDQRAALGIAGVAIKSGAQSAIASLWSVQDDATAQLMQAFYQHLITAGMSKALAFQAAQKQLIDKGHHPNHWSAFLLIGSWL